MNLYFAPLEGIGGYIYRNAQADFFPKADKYFSPFIAPNQNRSFNSRERKDIDPEHNEKIVLVPQILTNNAEVFIRTVKNLQILGYKEVNLNLGCPSRTVVTKYRGSGFLAKPEELDHFLEEVFAKTDVRISLKTRIGIEREEEFEKLNSIYDKYPLEELIIHPRLQMDYYKNKPHMEIFSKALQISRHRLVYNGDIFSQVQAEKFHGKYPQVDFVMLGRGVLADPCLFGELRGTGVLTKDKLKEFHARLLEDYQAEIPGDKNVLFKMKELWHYMAHVFTNHEKYAKKIRKAQRLCDYREVVRRLLAEQEIQPSDFSG